LYMLLVDLFGRTFLVDLNKYLSYRFNILYIPVWCMVYSCCVWTYRCINKCILHSNRV